MSHLKCHDITRPLFAKPDRKRPHNQKCVCDVDEHWLLIEDMVFAIQQQSNYQFIKRIYESEDPLNVYVFQGLDVVTKQEVALKFSFETSHVHPQREIFILQKLAEYGGHPRVQKLLACFSWCHAWIMVTEFSSGSNEVPIHSHTLYVKQLLEVVEWLHKNNVYHFDLKPSNVLWDEKKQSVFVCDFDCALLSSEEKFETGPPKGTEGYMAPEMLYLERDVDSSIQITEKADMFSIGCIICSLMFEIDEQDMKERMILDKRRLINSFKHKLTKLQTLYLHLVDKDPDTRWNTKQALEFLAPPPSTPTSQAGK
jgi:serine/threonine protein kinase